MTIHSLVFCLMLTAPALGALPVTVQPITGPSVSGHLQQLSIDQAVVTVDGKPRTLPARDLQSITMPGVAKEKAATTDDTVLVELTGGSRLRATRYEVAGGKATITLPSQTLPAEPNAIASVRFHAPSPTLDPQWLEIRHAAREADLVVVRRSETSLDQLEGVLHDVNPETIIFEFDDEKIPVKRTKLEGIIYFHATGAGGSKAACTVHDVNGSVWSVAKLALTEGSFQLVTTSGLTATLRADQVTRIDFASGNVVFLSDIQPEQTVWTPFVAPRIGANRLARMYRPRLNRGFEGEQLWLGPANKPTRYDKGISIHSRTLLTYRLGSDYRRFTAEAGIDSRLRGRGDVELVITGDSKQLLRRSVRGSDPPFSIDLDVQGVKRLKILVDFGDRLDVADHLNLCNARLIK